MPTVCYLSDLEYRTIGAAYKSIICSRSPVHVASFWVELWPPSVLMVAKPIARSVSQRTLNVRHTKRSCPEGACPTFPQTSHHIGIIDAACPTSVSNGEKSRIPRALYWQPNLKPRRGLLRSLHLGRNTTCSGQGCLWGIVACLRSIACKV